MSHVPPGPGPAPEWPQLDPSGQWQWLPAGQRWIPVQRPAALNYAPAQHKSRRTVSVTARVTTI